MTFSLYIAMIYKSSALQDILVKLLFIEYRLSQKIPLIWESDEWVQFNKQWIASTISDLLQRGQSLSTLGIFQSPSQPVFWMSRTRYVTSKKTAARETRYPLVTYVTYALRDIQKNGREGDQVSSCSAQIQQVASGKKFAFWLLPLFS